MLTMEYRKSSRSRIPHLDCVECRTSPDHRLVYMRDSKLRGDSPELVIPAGEWTDEFEPELCAGGYAYDKLGTTPVGTASLGISRLGDGNVSVSGRTVDGVRAVLVFKEREWRAFDEGGQLGEFPLPQAA